MLLHNRFDFLLRQPRHQAFSNARGMQKHPPPHPGVYLEKSWRLDFLDVHGFALIQDCKMNGEVNLFYKRSHEGKATAARSRFPWASPPRLKIFSPRR